MTIVVVTTAFAFLVCCILDSYPKGVLPFLHTKRKVVQNDVGAKPYHDLFHVNEEPHGRQGLAVAPGGRARIRSFPGAAH